LTMTPQRAELVADSLELGDADHTPWLDSLADLLRTAAEGVPEPADGPGIDPHPDAAAGTCASPLMSADLAWPAPGVVAIPAALSEADSAPAFANALALAAQAELIAARDLEELAVVATTVTTAAVAAAGTQTHQAADVARDAQAAAAEIAIATAETLRRAAHLVQLHTDEEAERVVSAAEGAARLVALAVVPGTEAINAETAAFLAATIRAAAVAKAEEAALAAATVARGAATAAVEAAAAAADAAMALELQVADTAAAVQAVATATARQVAADQVIAADLILTWAKVQKQNAQANLIGLR